MYSFVINNQKYDDIDLDSEEHWWLLSRQDSYSDNSSSSGSKIAPGINQARLSVRALAPDTATKMVIYEDRSNTEDNNKPSSQDTKIHTTTQSAWVSQTFSTGRIKSQEFDHNPCHVSRASEVVTWLVMK